MENKSLISCPTCAWKATIRGGEPEERAAFLQRKYAEHWREAHGPKIGDIAVSAVKSKG